MIAPQRDTLLKKDFPPAAVRRVDEHQARGRKAISCNGLRYSKNDFRKLTRSSAAFPVCAALSAGPLERRRVDCVQAACSALIATYDNANSLHTNAFDEAITTPTGDFQKRNAKQAPKMLQRLQRAVIDNNNVFEVLMDAVRVCSLGQITHALFEVGGRYRRNM